MQQHEPQFHEQRDISLNYPVVSTSLAYHELLLQNHFCLFNHTLFLERRGNRFMFVAESEGQQGLNKLHHCHVKILPPSWFELTHQESGNFDASISAALMLHPRVQNMWDTHKMMWVPNDGKVLTVVCALGGSTPRAASNQPKPQGQHRINPRKWHGMTDRTYHSANLDADYCCDC